MWGWSLRIVYRFLPDLGKEACGLFMDLDRIWGRRLTDCLRFFSGCGGRGLRMIVYGFLPDVVDEAYGLFTDFYRMWGMKLADCLQIWTGFGKEACGLFMDLDRIGAEGLRIVYGFFWMKRTRLTDDCLRIFTGCSGRSLRIVYRFLPDLGKEACGLFMDLDRIWGRRWEKATDCLRIFSGCGGRGLRIVYRILPDVEDEAYELFADFYRMCLDEAYGLLRIFAGMKRTRLTDCLRIFTGCGDEA